MTREQYISYFNNIKCTEEFRSQMEQLLSAEPDGKYADSVSGIEPARKINFQRITALAASAVIAVGISASAYHILKNGPDQPVASNQPTIEATTEAPQAEQTMPQIISDSLDNLENYNINGVIVSNEWLSDVSLFTLTDKAKASIGEILRNISWELTDSENVYMESDSPEDYIIEVQFMGVEDFGFIINKEGYLDFSDGENTSYYFVGDTVYNSLMATLANDALFCDYNNKEAEEKEYHIYSTFNEYRDILVETENISLTNPVTLTAYKPFEILFDETGNIIVNAPNAMGTMEKTISFASSEELAFKLNAISSLTEIPEGVSPDEAVDIIADNIITKYGEKLADIKYMSGSGQSDYGVMYNDVAISEIYEIVKSYNWVTAETNSFVSGNFYVCDSCNVTTRGELYDALTGTLYRAEGTDFTKLEEFFNNTRTSNALDDMKTRLVEHKNNFSTLEGAIQMYYYNNEFGEENQVSATGEMYYKNEKIDDYYTTSEIYYKLTGDKDDYYNVDYDCEFYKKNRYWTMIEKGVSVANQYYSDYGMEQSLVEEKDYGTVSGGYDNYDALLFDYDIIYSDAISTISDYKQDENDGYIEIFNVNEPEYTQDSLGRVNGLLHFGITYRYNPEVNPEDSDKKYYVYFTINSMGTIVHYEKTITDIETDELIRDFNFSVGAGKGYYYDEADFAIPAISAELTTEFDEVYGT